MRYLRLGHLGGVVSSASGLCVCVYVYIYILFVMSLALFNLEIWCFVVLSPYWGQCCGLHGNFYDFSLYFSFVWRTGLA